MRKILSFALVVVLCTTVFAQSPNAFNYQAIIRNQSGVIIPNTNVLIGVTILQGAIPGTNAYTETHSTTTNAYGLVNLKIGNGNYVSGNFATINWSTGIYFIEISVDGGIMGTSQLLSVPYAKYADIAGNGFSGNYNDLTNLPVLFDGTWSSLTGKPTFAAVASSGNYSDLLNLPILFNGDYNNLSNKPTLFSGVYSDLTGMPVLWDSSWATIKNKPVFFDGTWLNLSGKPTFAAVATSGSYSDLSNTPNMNNFLTQETQILSISNDTIYLTGNSFVKLPASPTSSWLITGNNIYNTNSGFVGIGTNTPSSTLHVNGSVRITDDTEGNNKVFTSDSLGNASWQTPSTANMSGTANYIPKFSNPNSLDNSLIYQSGNSMGLGTTAPAGRFVVKGDSLANDSVPLFEVQDKSGKTVFVVWPDGVHVFVDTSAAKTNNRGSFAVSGKSNSKSFTNEFFSVNSDSIKASKSLYIPRMTTVERNNLGFTPSDALIIFNTTDECMQIYKNGVWSNIWCFNCAPAFIIQPVNHIICSGDNTNFFVSLTGTNLVYQWQESINGVSWTDIVNGGTNPIYSGATSLSLSLANIPVNFNGYKYRCNVSAACPPGVTSSVVTLNVGSTPPVITTHPSGMALSTSYTASFSISSPGYGVTYQWQQSPDGTTWSDITNAGTSPVFGGFTAATLNLSSVPPTYNNYKFRCVASNSCGASASSNPATLTISVPTLTTTVASGIQSTLAASGGNVTSNGGAAVIARGVCWSTSQNPTILNSYTTDGTDTGSFTSNITGLTVDVTYYARAYATNGIGTAYGNEISFTTALVIGQNYLGGILAYILQPTDPGYVAGQTHGLIAAPSDQSTDADWGCSGTLITGADGTAIGTGAQNTVDIVAGCPTAGIAAKLCADLVLGGYSDWYLPSKDELNALYQNEAAIGGFASNLYWSSYEGDAGYAWVQNFTNGGQGFDLKYYTYYVRAVRAF